MNEISNAIRKLNPLVTTRLLEEQVLHEYLPKTHCVLCGKSYVSWLPTGEDNFTPYPIIGNGKRLGTCSCCGSRDRFRWIYWVLKNKTQLFDKKGTILHFAPELYIQKKIEATKNVYYTADIMEGRADYIVDITDIQFKDKLFDYIIANHILEHISEEAKAIYEMKRCLKDDGIIVLSFPICMEIDTLEEEAYNTEELREKYYGQKDHVRLYGRNYKERLEEYGLIVEVFPPNEYLSKKDINLLGLIENDIVMLCRKKA